MIELLERRFPTYEPEILAIMLEVTQHAFPTIRILHPKERVIALMHG
jgi:hypothetical protein